MLIFSRVNLHAWHFQANEIELLNGAKRSSRGKYQVLHFWSEGYPKNAVEAEWRSGRRWTNVEVLQDGSEIDEHFHVGNELSGAGTFS